MPAAWKLVNPLPTKKSNAGLSLAKAVLDACVSSPAGGGGAPMQPASAVAASDASTRRLDALMPTAAEQAEGQLAAHAIPGGWRAPPQTGGVKSETDCAQRGRGVDWRRGAPEPTRAARVCARRGRAGAGRERLRGLARGRLARREAGARRWPARVRVRARRAAAPRAPRRRVARARVPPRVRPGFPRPAAGRCRARRRQIAAASGGRAAGRASRGARPRAPAGAGSGGAGAAERRRDPVLARGRGSGGARPRAGRSAVRARRRARARQRDGTSVDRALLPQGGVEATPGARLLLPRVFSRSRLLRDRIRRGAPRPDDPALRARRLP